ncbi:unnamed protein product [Ceutorhynchus assimilis]|uniref:Uncharacterized protein n=1 Tax=Ceutorhynchus assimilis TaxID=467358 RepID=A0A9N9MX18_9CUCU|nr:unnamed protein product [Ceutorhynchus assimilis]
MSDNRKGQISLSDSDSEDYLQWKISRLKRRLAARKRKRQRSPSSSDSDQSSYRERQRRRSSSHRHSRNRRLRTRSPDPSPISVEGRHLGEGADDCDGDEDDIPLAVLAQRPTAATDRDGGNERGK